MRNDFQRVQLGELLTRSDEVVEIAPDKLYRQVTVRLWGKGVVLRDEVFGSDIAAARRCVVRLQQFILSKIDARNGAFGLVPDSLDGAVVSSDFPVFTLNRSRILPVFLDWISKTHDFIDLCKAASEGTTNRIRLREERFLATQISLPPLEEQQRIVARIEELAARIEEARGLRREVVEEADVLMDTATRSLFDELEKFNAKRSLRESAKIFGGGTPSKANVTFWQGTIPWVSPKDMKVRNLYDSEDHISELALQSGATTLIPKNSVLIVVRSGILRRKLPVSINRVPVTINQDMKALIPDNDILCDFLAWWFKGKETDILKNVKGGTTVQSVMWDTVREFNLCVPPLSEQSHIVAYLDSLQSRVDTLKQLQAETTAELDALLPSILDKAFKGELL